MTKEQIQFLQTLADKYETPEFCLADPSQFLRWYKSSFIADVETASFIAAMLAFGNRKQFIPKIKYILELADKTSGSITQWIKAGAPEFPLGTKKFHRFYSFDDMKNLFEELAEILQKSKSLGDFFKEKVENSRTLENRGRCGGIPPLEGVGCNEVQTQGETSPSLDLIISESFPKSKIVPKGKNSANKRIHMFLRWMVRQNSSVDLGIWDWYKPENLIIPLDVHVMEEAIKMNLLPPKATASRKTALLLTRELSQAFPNDPTRADFALFGLGVDENS